MAAIGRIRKHGVLLMIIIGVALLAFIVGDLTRIIPSITNKNLLARVGSEKMRVGNGDNMYTEFYNQNRTLLSFISDRNGTDDQFDQEIHDLTWQQVKQNILLDEELDNLGIVFHDDLVANISSKLLATLKAQPTTQAEALLQQMCGKWQQQLLQNGQRATIEDLSNTLAAIDEHRGTDFYNMYKAIERMYVLEAKEKAYNGLMAGSVYFSKTLCKQMADDNKVATMQLATIDPANPAFDNIKVTVSDEEAETFFKEHKNRYYVKDDVRDIDFAIFPIIPTTQDRKNTADTVQQIFNRFANANNISDFAKAEKKIDKDRLFSLTDGNFWMYNDFVANHVQIDTSLYLTKGKSALQNYGLSQNTNYNLPPTLDTLIYNAPAGTLIQPQLDGNFWYFGKVRDIAYRPDSIQATFLTIDFKLGQNSTSTRTQENAKQLADSLVLALQNNPNPTAVFSLLPSYKNEQFFQNDSTFWFTDGTQMLPDTLYNHLIATEVGGLYLFEGQGVYLVFQVMQKTQPIEKRQYVLYPVPVQASEKTIADLHAKANSLASESNSVDKLNELAKSKGAFVVKQTNITCMQGVINTNMQENLMCRGAISWAFEDETEVGTVTHSAFTGKFFYLDQNRQMQLGNEAYIVSGLRKVQERGKAEFENVKDVIIEELKAEKKKAAIEQQLKGDLAKSNIAEVAAKYNSRANDSVKVQLYLPNPYNNIENAAIGKIYTLPNNKPSVVTGKNIIYMVSVYNVEQGTASPKNQIENEILKLSTVGFYQQSMYQAANIPFMEKVYGIAMADLEKNVKIVDRRNNIYKGN